MPKFPHKPPAPSVREIIGPAIERSRYVPPSERPMSRKEVVRDLLTKLDLPPSLRAALKDRHKLE
jgi:hypothetical protein